MSYLLCGTLSFVDCTVLNWHFVICWLYSSRLTFCHLLAVQFTLCTDRTIAGCTVHIMYRPYNCFLSHLSKARHHNHGNTLDSSLQSPDSRLQSGASQESKYGYSGYFPLPCYSGYFPLPCWQQPPHLHMVATQVSQTYQTLAYVSDSEGKVTPDSRDSRLQESKYKYLSQ